MLKVKRLYPTHREKKRYIAYSYEGSCSKHGLVQTLQQMLGIFMSAQAGIIPVTHDEATRQGIIRVNHTAVDYIKSCFVLITQINNQPCQLQTMTVSGILKKAKHAQQHISQKV